MTVADPDEEDFGLLRAWQGGDKLAGNRLVRRHFSSVYRFFRTKFGEGVDDLTQQTFLGLVEAHGRYRGTGTFKAYLFGIARRQLLLALRKKSRAGNVFSPAEVSMSAVAGDSMLSPGRAVAQRQEQRLLLAALRTLPVDFQIVVELHYWEGMTVREIAEVVEVAPGTVKSRLSRARGMLERKIEQLAAQGGGTNSTMLDEDLEASLGTLSRELRPDLPTEPSDA